MNWEKLAFMLKQEADRVLDESFYHNQHRTEHGVAAGIAANYVLAGLSKCITLAIKVSDGH